MTTVFSVSYPDGEQMWRVWHTPALEPIDPMAFEGRPYHVVYKCYSKRRSDGLFTVAFFVSAQSVDDPCEIIAQRVLSTHNEYDELELNAFISGISAVIEFEYGKEAAFVVNDFSKCDTFEKFRYTMAEGTTTKITLNQEEIKRDEGEVKDGE